MQGKNTMDSVVNRRTLLALGMGSLVAALTGCGGGGGPSNNNGGGGGSNTVSGTIRDSAAGDNPIGGATVTIGGKSATTTTIDQASASNGSLQVGAFTVSSVPAGTNTLTVTFTNTRPTDENGGTETFTDTQTLQFTPAVTSGANNIGDLFVNIGQLAGLVLGTDGKPASGAFISISATGDSGIQTDANGRFFIANIPKGDTDVTAVLTTQSASRTVTVVNGLNDIGTLQLTADTNTNPPGVPTDIAGKITLSDGNSAEGTTVLLLRNGVQVEQTLAGTDGSYGFYVPTGSYSIRVLRDGYLEGNAAGTLSNTNVTLRMDVTISPRG